MSPTIQTVIALALVAGAVIFFVMRWWNKRNKPVCGGGCSAKRSFSREGVRRHEKTQDDDAMEGDGNYLMSF